MNVNTILDQLRAERQLVITALAALENLAANSKPRRGRPPKWLKDARERDAIADKQ